MAVMRAGANFMLISSPPFSLKLMFRPCAIDISVTVGPFTSIPCAAEIPSDRYSCAGRPFGVAQVTLPAGTWKVIGMQRRMKH